MLFRTPAIFGSHRQVEQFGNNSGDTFLQNMLLSLSRLAQPNATKWGRTPISWVERHRNPARTRRAMAWTHTSASANTGSAFPH